MGIRIECVCGKKLSIRDEMAGRRVKCPACENVLPVPQANKKAKPFENDHGAGDSWSDAVDQQLPPKSGRPRTRGTTAARPSGKTTARTKTKGNSSKNRNKVIAISAGVAVLIFGLLGWKFWSSRSEAENPVADVSTETGNTANASTTNPASAMPTEIVAPNFSGANAANTVQSQAGTASPAAGNTVAELDGDLKLLQGTWQVTDFRIDATQPTPPEVLNSMKQTTWTFDGKFLIMRSVDPRGTKHVNAFSVENDSVQKTKGLKLTQLSNVISNIPTDQSAIYSLSQDTMTVCMAKPGSAPPTEIVPNAAIGHAVFSFKKSQANSFAKPKFDLAQWIRVSERLKSTNVRAELFSEVEFSGTGEGFLARSYFKQVDGLIPPDIWKELLLLSTVHLGFDKESLVTDATLQQISRHPGLVGLSCDGPHTMSAVGVKSLQSCAMFSRLIYFSKTPLSSEVLQGFTEVNGLTVLLIEGQSLSSDLIAVIAKTKKLNTLTLPETGITDDDLMQISALTSLESLHLEKTQVTDDGMVHIKKLTALRTLFLPEQITDQGVEQLESLPQLEKLFLTGAAKITDKGLQSIKRHTNLKLLAARGTNISPQAWAEFEAALPACRVNR